MRKLITCAWLLCALYASGAGARGTVPIIDYENIAVATSSSTALSADAVRQAITAAAGATAGGWTVARTAGDVLVANLTVRGKHSVSVQIRYGEGAISIRYADSVNMKFSEEGGVRYIHPSYNKWVSNLVQSIRSELARR